MAVLAVDVMALIIMLLYISRGYRRGLIVSILSLAGLLAACASSYMFYKPAGRMIAERYDAPDYVTLALGAVMVFFCVLMLFSIITRIVSWRMRVRAQSVEGATLTWIDKTLGSLLGAIIGLTIIVALLWGYQLAQFTKAGKFLPDISSSIAVETSSSIIEMGTYLLAGSSMSDKDMARALAKSVSNPKKTAKDMQILLQNPSAQKLINDAEFVDAMLAGNEKRVKRNRTLNRMLDDPEVIKKAQELGLVSDKYEAAEMKNDVARKLAKIGGEIGKIRNDPKVQKILQEPEFAEKLQKGDFRDLANDERFGTLLNRVLGAFRNSNN